MTQQFFRMTRECVIVNARFLFILLIIRCRSRTSRGSWSAPSARSSSPTRSSCHASTASATSVCGSCSCWTMRTPLTPAPSAPCLAAPGPGCPRPPWRGSTGWWDQVRKQRCFFICYFFKVTVAPMAASKCALVSIVVLIIVGRCSAGNAGNGSISFI